MPANDTHSEKNRAYVEGVRSLRRAAIRRRQTLAAVLALATVIVAVLAVLLDFSLWYALIPLALLVVVLAFGVRAVRQAREWERKVALRQQRAAEQRKKDLAARARSVAMQRAQREAARQAAAMAAGQPPVDGGEASGIRNDSSGNLTASEAARNEASTAVMEQREIRRVIRDAQLAKARQIAEHQARLGAAEAAAQPVVQNTLVEHVTAKKPNDHAQLIVREEEKVDVDGVSSPSSDVMQAVDGPSTGESNAVDLISFSLGEPRNGVQVKTETPQSLEIKSTRQVAKAVPVKPSLDPVDADGHSAVHTVEDPVAAQDTASEPDESSTRSETVEAEPVATGTGDGQSGRASDADDRSRDDAAARTDGEMTDETAEAAAEAAAVVDSAEDLTDELAAVKPRRTAAEAGDRRPARRGAQPNRLQRERTAQRQSKPLRDASSSGSAFHESESSSDVDAPDASSDSLGVSLDNILARRGN
ncbi:DUF2339 domain-containing protein [Bifidobacterium choloepi]|uniref:Cytochrome d ubiquinol oxidase subunit II n=1 Tax=Bifidobacterium choloepi TaxID=2614131 RepID=A0A6I5MZF2_9BIFI|nr:cytochrome d ubiquinol oxidase subunit II [Bifidobacterium choloepi]NEG69677.1 cytochrome d ubiquinol oxidase subunit II [Bifidobacterium choloepi]